MAQKVVGYIKLQIAAGKATPAPPVGPALGQHGVNIMAFTKEFNERTKNDAGMIIPVVITVYADRSFSFITKTPPAAVLIKKACNINSGSGSSQRLHLQQFLSRRLATSTVVQAFLTRLRLLTSLRNRFRRSLSRRCPILTQVHSRLL